MEMLPASGKRCSFCCGRGGPAAGRTGLESLLQMSRCACQSCRCQDREMVTAEAKLRRNRRSDGETERGKKRRGSSKRSAKIKDHITFIHHSKSRHIYRSALYPCPNCKYYLNRQHNNILYYSVSYKHTVFMN